MSPAKSDKKARRRPPRFAVPNNEQAAISVGGRRIAGTVRVLSLTGGTVELVRPLPESTMADFRMNTVSGPFAAVVEFLPSTRKGTQAFRFVHVDGEARRRLSRGLDAMRAQGLGDVEPNTMEKLLGFAKRAMGKKS